MLALGAELQRGSIAMVASTLEFFAGISGLGLICIR